MYTFVLALHSLVRWVVLVLAVVAIVRAWWGWLGGKPWSGVQKGLNVGLVSALDLQLLLGLWLYAVLSPLTQAAFQNFGGAMKSGPLRFWAVEHIGLMIVAIVLAHVGQALSKRAPTDAGRYKRAAIFFTLALVAILVAIPWPGTEVARPLLRGF